MEKLSLGVFNSEILGFFVRTDQVTSFSNDVEVGSIQVEYTPTTFMKDITTLERLNIDRLTIHWDGLLGKNIQQIIGNIKGLTPKTSRLERPVSSSSRTLQIKEVQLNNTTIVVHIGGITESIHLPDLELHNIHGDHHNVLRQILEQIQSKMKERHPQ